MVQPARLVQLVLKALQGLLAHKVLLARVVQPGCGVRLAHKVLLVSELPAQPVQLDHKVSLA